MRRFAMRLALALGKTLKELENEMSAAEFMEWVVFFEKEPFGAIADNYRAALISSIIANVNRDPKKRAYEIEDFLLGEKPQATQSDDDIMNIIMRANAVLGGTITKEGGEDNAD